MSITADLPRSRSPIDHPTYIRHFVLAALLAITLINYVQRNSTGPATTTIMKDMEVTRSDVGVAAGAFFLSYTIMQLPSGLFAQWMGAKWALTIIAAGWSLAMIGCGMARDMGELYLARLILGAMQAGIFPCATLILQVWYPAARRGLATALLNCFMVGGGVVGTLLTGELLQVTDWRTIFISYCLPGLLWAAWFAWWFVRTPQQHPGVNPEELALITAGRPATPNKDEAPAAPARGWRAYLFVFCSLPLILLCTQQGFRAGANRLFDNWMPTYYEEERETSKQMASRLSAIPQVACFLGGLMGGLISDEVLRRTGSRRAARKWVAIVTLLGSIVCYFLAWPIGNVLLATIVFSLGAFLFSVSSPCAYALALDIGGKYLAVVFALMNTIGNVGAYLFVSYLSFVVDWAGWDAALGVFVLMHVAAVLCWLWLDPEVIIGEPKGLVA